MKTVIAAILGFRKITDLITQKLVTGALGRHAIKKVTGIDAELVQIINDLIFGKWQPGAQNDRKGMRTDLFMAVFLDRNKIIFEAFKFLDQIQQIETKFPPPQFPAMNKALFL